MGWLYKITNKTNQKKYFGITKNHFEVRFKEHIKRAIKGYEKFKIHEAINKYGEENFEIEGLIKHNNWNLLCKLEILYIKKYQTFDDCFGYNMTKGGDGGKGHKMSDEGKRILSLKMKETLKIYGHPMSDPKIIAKYFRGKNHPYYTSKLRSNIRKASKQNLKNSWKNQEVKVEQLDPITFEIINTFDSILKAAKFHGLANGTTIGDCINGRQANSAGFKWKKK